MRMLTCLALAFCVIAGAACSDQTHGGAADSDILVIETKTARCWSSCARTWRPSTSSASRRSPREGFYDGHEIPPRHTAASWRRRATRPAPAWGGSNYPDLPAEFSQEPFKRGTRRGRPHRRPQQRQQPVLHLLRRQRLLEPHRPVHGVGPGDRRHGARRQDRQGRAAGHPRRDGEGVPAVGRQVAAAAMVNASALIPFVPSGPRLRAGARLLRRARLCGAVARRRPRRPALRRCGVHAAGHRRAGVAEEPDADARGRRSRSLLDPDCRQGAGSALCRRAAERAARLSLGPRGAHHRSRRRLLARAPGEDPPDQP